MMIDKRPTHLRWGNISIIYNGSQKLLRCNGLSPERKIIFGCGYKFIGYYLRLKGKISFILGLFRAAVFTADFYIVLEDNVIGCYDGKFIGFHKSILTTFTAAEHYEATFTVC